MKPAADSCASVQDLLLDYAYGELDAGVRKDVETHVAGCVGCRTALAQLSGTRALMASLPAEPPPEAGLESLLAYAEQAARNRSEQAATSRASYIWRWLVPALGLVSASAVALLIVAKPGDPSRGLAPVAAPVSVAVQSEPTKPTPSLEPTPTPAPPAVALPVVPAAPEKPAEPALAKADEARRVGAAKDAVKTESNLDALLRAGAAKPDAPAKVPMAVATKSNRDPELEADFDRTFGGEDKVAGKKGALAQASEGAKNQKAAEQSVGDGRGVASGSVGEPRQEKEMAGAGGGGEAIGSPHYARQRAQIPIYGPVPRDEQPSYNDDSTTTGLMSNAAPLGGAKPKAMPPAPAPKPSAPAAQPAPEPVVAVAEAKSAKREDQAPSAPRGPAAAPATAAPAEEARPADAAKKVALLTPEELLRKGADQSNNGDLAGAEATYAAFLAQYPAHSKAPEVALWRVALLERLGRTGDAAVARADYARRWPSTAPGGAAASGPRGAPASPARAAPMEKAKAADFSDDAAIQAH